MYKEEHIFKSAHSIICAPDSNNTPEILSRSILGSCYQK